MTDVRDYVHVHSEVGLVCDPLEEAQTGRADRNRSVAPRSASLDGKVLAVIDNGIGKQCTGLGFAECLVRKMRQVVRFADVIYVLKDAVNVAPRPEDWEEVCRRGDVGLTLYGA